MYIGSSEVWGINEKNACKYKAYIVSIKYLSFLMLW